MRIIHREFGASEAGIALSVVTGVVIALGYAALRFLSGSAGVPPVEIRQVPPGEVAGILPKGPHEEQPQVLPAQDTEGQYVPHVSQRPLWEPRPFAEAGNDIELSGLDSLWPTTDELPVRTVPFGGAPR